MKFKDYDEERNDIFNKFYNFQKEIFFENKNENNKIQNLEISNIEIVGYREIYKHNKTTTVIIFF